MFLVSVLGHNVFFLRGKGEGEIKNYFPVKSLRKLLLTLLEKKSKLFFIEINLIVGIIIICISDKKKIIKLRFIYL